MAVFQTIYQTLDNNLVDFEIKFLNLLQTNKYQGQLLWRTNSNFIYKITQLGGGYQIWRLPT